MYLLIKIDYLHNQGILTWQNYPAQAKTTVIDTLTTQLHLIIFIIWQNCLQNSIKVL